MASEILLGIRTVVGYDEAFSRWFDTELLPWIERALAPSGILHSVRVVSVRPIPDAADYPVADPSAPPVDWRQAERTFNVELPAYSIALSLVPSSTGRFGGYDGGWIRSELVDPDAPEPLRRALSALELCVLCHALREVDVGAPGYLEGLAQAVGVLGARGR